MNAHSIVMYLLVLLGAAVVAVPLATRLGLGNVMGYLLAGVALGPWGLKVIWNVHDILAFSEFGVVLLLFVIGLELRPGRLWNMRRDIFGLGSMQILFSMIALLIPLAFLPLGIKEVLVLAFGFSLSSTAFAMQILTEKHEINTQYGRASFAVLLFQDIAVVPVMIVLPLVAGVGGKSAASILPGIGAFILLLIVARYAVRPFFRIVVRAKSRELFTAASLLLVFSIAAFMEAVGLSMALGTFAAGVILSESEYRHELEASIEPFKGLLLGLFFMAVGMSMNLDTLPRHPVLIPAAVVGLISLKIIAIYGAGVLFRYQGEVARNMAFLISQGGEFAFVLFALAREKSIFSEEVTAIANITVALSLMATPLVYVFNARVLRTRFSSSSWQFDEMPSEHNSVILAGFGRYGQIMGRMLRLNGIEFTALEIDYEQVQAVRKFGNKVYYGDASRLDLLRAAGAGHAKIFVLAVDDVEASTSIARIVSEHFPNLKILARARNRHHAYDLLDAKVHDIRREVFASSLETAHVMLKELGFSEKKADRMVQKFRDHDEKQLLAQMEYRDDEKRYIDYTKEAGAQLAEVFRLDAAAEEKD